MGCWKKYIKGLGRRVETATFRWFWSRRKIVFVTPARHGLVMSDQAKKVPFHTPNLVCPHD